MTFSIVARCAETGMFGVAVSSSSPAVAARCAHARAGVGAVASQNITDPGLGARGLDLMELGARASEAITVLRETAPHIDYRQLTAVDASGQTGFFHGARVLGTHAHSEVHGAVAAGNILSNHIVPEAMTAAFEATSGHLGDRLIAAMRAAIAAGGEEGPVHSAGMKIVDQVPWPVADLRVDWIEDDPIEELAQLWDLYKPQLKDYVTRALDPEAAPSYGVPGDE
ncbi:MAG: DUF1028 domain-containing protein [Paracoccaceae bacterium]|nr:DUF1028 domain-containing protein [Paracoccaceae bacterium]